MSQLETSPNALACPWIYSSISINFLHPTTQFLDPKPWNFLETYCKLWDCQMQQKGFCNSRTAGWLS